MFHCYSGDAEMARICAQAGGVATRPLLGPADIRDLAALGVRPTKQRGSENFVIDANTVRRIVRTAEVRPDDTVVEVGPGSAR
ncbi:Ribosomal RNA small subunit methyltransferase A [Streptomyces californicus]